MISTFFWTTGVIMALLFSFKVGVTIIVGRGTLTYSAVLAAVTVTSVVVLTLAMVPVLSSVLVPVLSSVLEDTYDLSLVFCWASARLLSSSLSSRFLSFSSWISVSANRSKSWCSLWLDWIFFLISSTIISWVLAFLPIRTLRSCLCLAKKSLTLPYTRSTSFLSHGFSVSSSSFSFSPSTDSYL